MSTGVKRYPIPLCDLSAQHEPIMGEIRAGHLGCFSFFPSKNLGCLGDGGMVVTRSPEMAEKLRVLRGHGAKPKYFHATIGGNFRLDTIHAAALLVKLRHLDGWNVSRRVAADRYRDLFAGAGLNDQLVPPTDHPESYHIYNQFCIRSPERDALVEQLRRQQIGTAIYYPLPLHSQQCFHDLGYGEGNLPVSERAVAEVFTVPIVSRSHFGTAGTSRSRLS